MDDSNKIGKQTLGLFSLVGLAAMVSLASYGLSSCSLVLDFDECTTGADCAEAYGEGAACMDGICEGSVETPLLGGPCTASAGDIDAENAFHVGIILSLSGGEQGFGKPLLDAMKVARKDLATVNGVQGRPMTFVICDSESTVDGALASAEHLRDAGVEVIVGPDSSSQTIEVATSVAIPAEMAMVSPPATATRISKLDDEGLVWRTTPSDLFQAEAMGLMIDYVIRTLLGKTFDESRVVILTREQNSYTQGLREGLVEFMPGEIVSKLGMRHRSLEFPNPAKGQGTDFSGVVADVLALPEEPDVVVLLGYSESWEIMTLLEQNLTKEPYYLVPDAAKNLEAAQGAPASLQGRVLGTAPRNISGTDYPPYTSFKVKFVSTYGQDPNQLQFVANAFDAIYVVALAAAAEGFTGPDIARGMARLSDKDGAKIRPNADEALDAYQILEQGNDIDYVGASGQLDFDENGDISKGAIGLWCFENDRVPEKGVILTEGGEFEPRDCSSEPNGGDDMGTNPDMGSDMGSDNPGSDLGMDMGVQTDL